MTQLVELQEALPKFEAAGIKLYAVSYDAPDALADFAANHGITYPLLSDKGSKLIRRLGIQNHHVTRDQVPYHGVPFPGTYVLDESGLVTEKFFNRNLAARDSADSMIDSALGEILLGDNEPTDQSDSDEIRISATFHGGGGCLKGAVVRQIVVRFELAAGLHIYDNPVPEGMVATRIEVTGPPGLITGSRVQPPTHALNLPGLDTVLQVWDGRVDFAIPVWADDRIGGLLNKSAVDEVDIHIDVSYQACDDKACRLPQSARLTLRVPTALHVGHAMAGRMGGAVTTEMNSGKHMKKMVSRGLLRSPIKGIRYLKESMAALRNGPAMKRPTTAEKKQ